MNFGRAEKWQPRAKNYSLPDPFYSAKALDDASRAAQAKPRHPSHEQRPLNHSWQTQQGPLVPPLAVSAALTCSDASWYLCSMFARASRMRSLRLSCRSAILTASYTVSRSHSRKFVSATSSRPVPACSSSWLMRPKAKNRGPREPVEGSWASMRVRCSPSFTQNSTDVLRGVMPLATCST